MNLFLLSFQSFVCQEPCPSLKSFQYCAFASCNPSSPFANLSLSAMSSLYVNISILGFFVYTIPAVKFAANCGMDSKPLLAELFY